LSEFGHTCATGSESCRLELTVGIVSPAERHRLQYTSAQILAVHQMRMAAQASQWGPVSVLVVFSIMLCMLCMIAVAAAVVAVPNLRNKLTVLLTVVSAEVRHLLSENWIMLTAWIFSPVSKEISTPESTGACCGDIISDVFCSLNDAKAIQKLKI
jgi:hypothetical protein